MMWQAHHHDPRWSYTIVILHHHYWAPLCDQSSTIMIDQAPSRAIDRAPLCDQSSNIVIDWAPLQSSTITIKHHCNQAPLQLSTIVRDRAPSQSIKHHHKRLIKHHCKGLSTITRDWASLRGIASTIVREPHHYLLSLESLLKKDCWNNEW
jgi:hypothetical protein